MTTEPAITILSAASTREELVYAIQCINYEAHRAQTIVGSQAYPSHWDSLHEFMDGLLDLIAGL